MRVGGVLLEGREILLAAYYFRRGVEAEQRRNGGELAAGTLELRDQLAREAGRQTVAVVDARGSSPVQVNGGRGSTSASAVVVLAGSGPEMTTAQVAAQLGITPRAVRNLCDSGRLLAQRGPSGWWVIDANSAAEMAARRKGA